MIKKNFRRGEIKDADGTFIVGSIHDIPFDRLVEVFGTPDPGDGCKTDVDWVIKFDNGVVATIYNWKDGPIYGGLDVEFITRWNIGGHSSKARYEVEKVLGIS